MLLAVLMVTLLWRLPSLFDPPWVNDEGTYFAVAQSVAHGARLYVDIWENKPPGIYLLYSAVYHLAGASLIPIRLVTTCVVLGLVLLTARISLHFADLPAAILSSMLAGLLLGLPFLEGTTGNAEVFLAAFSASAVYLATVKGGAGRAGVLMAGALLFKAVAVFDAAALGLWILQQERRLAWQYAAGLAVPLIAFLAVAWLLGILPAMIRDALLYDLGYVGSKNGGDVPWLLLLKVGSLIALAGALRHAPFPVLWLLFASAGALTGGRFFGHYALQAAVPLAVCAGLVLQHRDRLAFRLAWALPAGFLLLAGASAATGWAIATSGHDSILARRLQWYANFVRLSLRQESYAMYRSQIDDHVDRNIRVVGALDRLPAGRMLVWGNVPWVYVLSHRLPATPYTSALRAPPVPGETSTLRRALVVHRAQVVVLIRPALPRLGSAETALRHFYRPVSRVDNAWVYVLAEEQEPQL